MNLPLSLNRFVSRDVVDIRAYYDQEGGWDLAEQFHGEVILCMDKIWESPKGFPFFIEDYRRANLKRFPYHIIYRITANSIRILILRHNNRHPEHGLNRK